MLPSARRKWTVDCHTPSRPTVVTTTFRRAVAAGSRLVSPPLRPSPLERVLSVIPRKKEKHIICPLRFGRGQSPLSCQQMIVPLLGPLE